MLVVSETEISRNVKRTSAYLIAANGLQTPRRFIYAVAIKYEKQSKIISTQSAIDVNAESLPAIGD